MFIYLHKNRKGFTLIELMVVVAIIGVLALLGLRLYTTQQDRSKEAIAKANAGSVQVAIQTELVDNPTLTDASGIPDLLQLRNPFDGGTGWAATGAVYSYTDADYDDDDAEGFAGVEYSDPIFIIRAFGKDGKDLDYELTARP
jgi:prepilin-type N-terminal cleavage/methylation domain-containing protein